MAVQYEMDLGRFDDYACKWMLVDAVTQIAVDGPRWTYGSSLTDKTGRVVSIKGVHPTDELVMITKNGVVNRQGVDGIRVIGRNTQGVRLITLDDGDEVMDVARLVPEEDEEGAVEVPAGSEPGAAEAAGAELADGEAVE